MTLETSYDDIPYPRLTFPYTHPSHLATIGRLLGLRPAAVERCRVLEFGCAGGGNLAPMAYSLPGATLVGIDRSTRQIDEARAAAAAIGLRNARFEPLDILTAAEPLAREFGGFDYIIAHGIYSWVPDPVKDALLAACRRLLAPEGIAYVSYNCYPGCEPRDMLRRICQYHGRRAGDSRKYAGQTRRFLEFILQSVPAGDTAYRATLREQAAGLLAESDAVLLHDDLERDNDPCFFHQFAEHAGRHGLQYLGDAYFGQMLGVGIPAAALEKIRQVGDTLAFEQYLDFFYGRALRTTLLCHREARVRRDSAPEALDELWISSSAIAASAAGTPLGTEQLDDQSDQPITYRAADCTLAAGTPVAKAALRELAAASPGPLRFGDLLDRVRQRLGAGTSGDAAAERNDLANMAIEWFAMRLVELHAFSPPLASSPGERPVASAAARFQLAERPTDNVGVPLLACPAVETGLAASTAGQASSGTPENNPAQRAETFVSNLFLRRVRLGGELAAQVLARLDGRHDRAAIVEALAAPVLQGRAALRVEGRAITDPQAVRRFLAERVETCLADFARNALLVDAECIAGA